MVELNKGQFLYDVHVRIVREVIFYDKGEETYYLTNKGTISRFTKKYVENPQAFIVVENNKKTIEVLYG